jgi:hypothetical protein
VSASAVDEIAYALIARHGIKALEAAEHYVAATREGAEYELAEMWMAIAGTVGGVLFGRRPIGADAIEEIALNLLVRHGSNAVEVAERCVEANRADRDHEIAEMWSETPPCHQHLIRLLERGRLIYSGSPAARSASESGRATEGW